MRLAVKAVCLVFIQAVWMTGAFSQDADEPTAEEWRMRIFAARERLAKLREEGKLIDQDQAASQENAVIEEQAIKRGMEDEDLRPGDIVVTRNGFLRFEGYSSDATRIFVPANPK